MNRLLNAFALSGLLLAGATAGAATTLAYLPHYGTERMFTEMNKRTPLIANELRHSSLRYAPKDFVPRDNPDTVSSLAKYDLTEGPVRFVGAVPENRVYWSVSLFAHNTDNFFVLNDRDLKTLRPAIVIVRKGQDYAPQPGELVAVSPSVTGVLIVRLIVPDRNDGAIVAANAAFLKQATMGPAT